MKYYVLNKATGRTKSINAESALVLKRYRSHMWRVMRADGRLFNESERKALSMRPSYVKHDAVWVDEQLESSFSVAELSVVVAERNKIEYKTVFDFISSNVENLRVFDVASAYAIICKELLRDA